MRIKLGRNRPVVRLGFTGRAFCGCFYSEGMLFSPCDFHFEPQVLRLGPVAMKVGRHRRKKE